MYVDLFRGLPPCCMPPLMKSPNRRCIPINQPLQSSKTKALKTSLTLFFYKLEVP